MKPRSNQTKSVVPIFEAKDGASPEFVGSGILIGIGTARFLISAAHIFDSNVPKSHFIPLDGELVQIRGHGRISTPPEKGRFYDLNDCVFIKLEEPFISSFERSGLFLSASLIEMSDVTSENDVYVFSGFPAALESRDVEAVAVSRSCLGSQPQSTRIYRKCGCSRESHIVISNPTNNWTDSDEKKLRSNNELEGMSGGGVWKMLNDSLEMPELVLVGIIIEHHKRLGAVVGVRINGIVECIREIYPDLDRFLPMSSILNVILQDTEK